ncbi:MAG: response regulator [Steroidobacteraceae bacterium]|jgi:CheY-like chemotaxis protein
MSSFQEIDILYAEDSPTDAEVTMRALKKANLGNNLLWVKDGQEALDVLLGRGQYAERLRTSPRLVLLDLKMPKVDGLEVLRTIRSTDSLRAIPVVMLTSSAEESDLAKSYELGINSYIVKPIDFTSLSDAVARLGYYWVAMNRLAESTV